jgi:hypothetical protein
MPSPTVLYSANTWLAYHISKNYYHNIHWVWCSAYFDSRSVLGRDYTNPPSSTPGDVYKELREATSRADRHSAKIAANRIGLLKGATYKRSTGVINDQQLSEITSIIEAAEIIEFRPLMYVIPVTDEVAKIMKEAPILERAHPLSVEYIIEELSRHLFDIIEPY